MVTKEQAMTFGIFYHVRQRNADGTDLRVRRNGKTQTWKTRPGDFRVPVKYGLKECLYIDQDTAHNWSVTDPTETKEQGKVREMIDAIMDEVDSPVR